jgi:cytochrome b561
MKSSPYTRTQVALHWLSAVIIVWATISGFYVGLLPVSAGLKSLIGFINVSLTTLLIPFFFWRTVLAWQHRGRAGHGSGAMAWVVKAVHGLLYGLTWLVLISGVLMMDRPINVFNVVQFPAPLSDPQLTHAITQLHIILCVLLGGLVGLHVAAVIKHQLCGNKVLRRMSW